MLFEGGDGLDHRQGEVPIITTLFPKQIEKPLTGAAPRWDAVRRSAWRIAGTICLALCLNVLVFFPTYAQLQQSGGVATVTVTQATGTNLHAVIDSGTVAVSGGTANIGFVRIVPSSCTQSTNFSNSTAQVATGAGTSVTGTTTCVTYAYANNITNSAVTLRIADKQGTPVIWLGGNADFIIPANSNLRIPIDGVTFTSGITAIAGTATAVNLQVNGLQ